MIRTGYRLGLSASFVYFIHGSAHTLARMPRAGGAIETILVDDFIVDLAVVGDGAFVSIGNRGVFRVRDTD